MGQLILGVTITGNARMVPVCVLPDGTASIVPKKVVHTVVPAMGSVGLTKTVCGNVAALKDGMAMTVPYFWSKPATMDVITIKVIWEGN